MNPQLQIYHNPQCSKSREALEYLLENGHEPEVIDYQKTPPSEETVRHLVKLLGVAPSSMIRPKDFNRLGLEPTDNFDELVRMISRHPIIMERPIIVLGDKAVIAKPLEKLRELL